MVIYSVGQRVSKTSNTGKKGYIDSIVPASGGHQFYEVLWDDGHMEVIAEVLIRPEVRSSTPWELFTNNEFCDFRDFSITTTFHKIRNTTTNTVSTLKASRTIFKPYQFKPLVKFLRSDLRRVLIADEVGLGKTIEAGHIMLELAARGNMRNALVICTKSLIDKWEFELLDKFFIKLKKYDRMQYLIDDIKDDIATSRKSVFGIINYEKIRNTDLLRIIEENNYHFDLLICDEAHKVRNSKTQQHKGVDKIVKFSDAVAFLTATPIMTDLKNLHNLVRILDHEGYDTFDIFNNAMSLNKPFIKALSRLNAGDPLPIIAEELHNTVVKQEMTIDEKVFSSVKNPVSALFENDALYNRARGYLLNGSDDITTRALIQQDLVELNSLNNIYSRTRKRDVLSGDDIVSRDPITIEVRLSEEEREIYDSVINDFSNPRSLGLMQNKRQMASCIVAFRSDRDALLEGTYDRSIYDSKFEAFSSIIEEVIINNQKKIIVFAFFTNTLLYLRQKLIEKGIISEIIYGGIKDRTERIENFRYNNDIKVLLSSEVGSEGIDLQFCNAIVNYDLPWNPMVVEQRIGRIDRIGQEEKIVHIYNLIICDTIEEKIYERLYERINLFRETIGDLDEILGESEPLGEIITKGIESLYKTRLSESQQNAELDRMRTAIENERLTLERIRSGLEESFANDIHFQTEIEAIERNNRYLTKEEIIKYIESIIRTKLSTVRLTHFRENVSELEVPNCDRSILFKFIEQYKDPAEANPELEILYKKFKARFTGERKIPITFDQEYAYRHKVLEYISAFHPLINAITNYFEKEGYCQNRAYKILLRKEVLAEDTLIDSGFYILAVYKVTVQKHFGGGKTNNFFYMRSVMAQLNDEGIILVDEKLSDNIFGLSQLKCELFTCELTDNLSFIDEVRPVINLAIIKDVEKIKENEEVKFISGLNRRTEQEVNFLNSRISRISKLLEEGKGIEAILRSEIENLSIKKDELLRNRELAKVEAENTLLSVNLLEIQ
jgi:superfamily II DNA or RNA helicase